MELLAEGIFYAVTSSLVFQHLRVIMFNKITQTSFPLPSLWDSAIFIQELELSWQPSPALWMPCGSPLEMGVWGRFHCCSTGRSITYCFTLYCFKHCNEANLKWLLLLFGSTHKLHRMSNGSFAINEKNHQLHFQISPISIFSIQQENDSMEILLVNKRVSFILSKVDPIARKNPHTLHEIHLY